MHKVHGHLENELRAHVFFKKVFVLEVRVWAGPVVLGCFGSDLKQTRRAGTKSITQADRLTYANGSDQLRGWIGLIMRTDWTDQAGFH